MVKAKPEEQSRYIFESNKELQYKTEYDLFMITTSRCLTAHYLGTMEDFETKKIASDFFKPSLILEGVKKQPKGLERQGKI